jgi:hypothetical protein
LFYNILTSHTTEQGSESNDFIRIDDKAEYIALCCSLFVLLQFADSDSLGCCYLSGMLFAPYSVKLIMVFRVVANTSYASLQSGNVYTVS